jgi:hypothetical protein
MSSLVPHPSVVCTILDEGGVLLHLDTKYYYSLNRSGMAVWSALEAGAADPQSLARAAGLDGNGSGEGAATIRSFLADLEAARLVEPGVVAPGLAPQVPAATPPSPESGGEPPRLVRHDIPLNQILSNPFDPSVPLAE